LSAALERRKEQLEELQLDREKSNQNNIIILFL